MGWGSKTFRISTGVIAAVVFAVCGAVPGIARAADWVKDPQNGCATSNPFPNPNESIRWSGGCANGKLDGRGTLIWIRDGVETERNEGMFHDGEMDGPAVTRYPDGNVVYGQYQQGQRHGTFMTVRANGDHIQATYVEGRMVNQKKLSAAEAGEWKRTGVPQQIAGAPTAISPAPAAGEEPVTGRTAISSPSRTLPPPPKAATAPGVPIASAKAPAAAKPSGNFTLGTQVADAVGSGDSTPPQPITPAAAPPSRAASPPPAPAYTAPPPARAAAATAPLPTLPQFSLGSQVEGAVDRPSTLAATPPQMPTLTANIPSAPLPQPQYQPQLQPAPQQAQQPTLQPAPWPARQSAQAPAQMPQPVETLGPPRGTPTAITQRRPPWMAAGAADPVALGPPLPGNTPPPLPPTPMASVSPLPAAPNYAQAAPAYPPQAYAPQAELSPTEASRRYLAARESGAINPPQMAALPSYRALQPASPYPYQPQAAAPLPSMQSSVAAQLPPPVAMPGGGAYAAGGPEALFKQGYQLEMSGRFREAEQAYEQVMIGYSNSQTAMLANERLNGLRRFTRENGVRIAGQPGTEQRQSQVVAVNEPRLMPGHAPQNPAYAFPPPLSTGGTGAGVTAGEEGGGMVQNLTNMSVCTQKGLYDKEARWCGIVRADDGKRLAVEVRDVVLPRFGSWSIDASTCTGGSSINWFSKGSMVRVPRACMEIKG